MFNLMMANSCLESKQQPAGDLHHILPQHLVDKREGGEEDTMQERGCQLPQYCHQIHIYCYGFSYYMSCQAVKTQHQKGL